MARYKFLIISLVIVNSFTEILTAQRVVSNAGGGGGRLNANKFGPNGLARCTDVKDIIYADCYSLKEAGICQSQKTKMKYYCPLTCRFCSGSLPDDFRVPQQRMPKCLSAKYGCCKDNDTSALGPNYLGCPEKCFDTAGYPCDFYKNVGFCAKSSDYYDSMLKLCPRVCDFCEPTNGKPIGKCHDVWKPSYCKKFQKLGYCKLKQFKRSLSQKCRKTCKFCQHHSPELQSIAAKCAETDNCCWDKSAIPKIGTCPECKDLFSPVFCKNFKDDCTGNQDIKNVQIRILCTKTCGMCNDGCTDDVVHGEYCAVWKSRGNCENNPQIMNVYCKKTCGFC